MAVLAMLLCVPSLEMGFFLDDYMHRASLVHPPELPQMHASPDQLFAFVTGEPGGMTKYLPWWSPEELRIAMWRPVAGRQADWRSYD